MEKKKKATSSSSSKEKDKKDSPTVSNRRALHDYAVLKKFEAGIVLQGSEVKSCRLGKVQLVDAYATLERGELYLYKAHIAEFKQSGPYFNHPTVRKRKLLLHKAELKKIETELKTSGTTLIPLKVFFKRGFVKVELAVARGKTKGDKRETLKRKDQERAMDQARKRG